MKNRNIHVLEEMPVSRAIIYMALPSVLSMLVNILYNLTDTFFIGKLNDPVQVAAVSISMPLFGFQMAIAGIFGAGGASYLSRLLGRKDFKQARETTTTALFSALLASIVVTIGGILFIPTFLRLAGASGEIFPYATRYLTIILLGSPFVMLKFAMVQLVRAEGSARQAMFGLIIGTGVNIVLDPLFIFVFNMGVTGAAVATVIGQGLAMLYYVSYYRGKNSIARPSPKYLSLRREIYKQILFIGLPASLGQIMMNVGNTISYNLASAYGDSVVASLGVASRVFSIPIFVFIGTSIGVQALIGFNYGARNFARMKLVIRRAVFISLSLSVFFTLLFALFPRQLIGTFIKDESIMDIGTMILEAYVFAIPFAAVGMIMANSLQAMGKALPAFIVSLSRQGIIYIPLLFLLNTYYGFEGLIFAMPMADALTTLISSSLVFFILRGIKHKEPAPGIPEPMPVPADMA